MDAQRMVETELGSLAVRVSGSGTPSILWPSLFVDERSWHRFETEVAGRQFVVISGPGHGASQDPGRRYTLEECAAATATVLEALGIQGPVDWIGNAWGGHVGILFAVRWPARIRTLVTVGTPIEALTLRERARTHALVLAYRFLENAKFVEDGVVEVLLSARTRSENPAAVELVKDCLSNADPAALRNAIVSISLHRPDLSSQLPKVSAPTLFITGRDHTGWTPRQASDASRLLQHGSMAVVPDAAYLAPLERPAEVAQLVSQFWAAQAPASRDHS